MAKEKTQYRNINEIMGNPDDATRLQGYIDEAVLARTRIDELREHIKAITEAAKGDLHIDPKVFKFYADRAYNNDCQEALEQVQEKVDLLERMLLLANEL